MMKRILLLLSFISIAANAAPSTMEVKKRGNDLIKQTVEPILNQYCREQCQIIHVETEVDLAIDDMVSPGFEESSGKATLAPAAGKIKILMDEALGSQTRQKIVNLMQEHLEQLDFSVQLETKVQRFPQPASSGYRVADLRMKVIHDIRASIQSMLGQFCPDACFLGEFDVQTEVVNPEDIDYSSHQEYFQDGPAAIRVRGVRATIMTDQSLSAEEANGIIEMARLKVAAFRGSMINTQNMRFPKPGMKGFGNGLYAGNGAGYTGAPYRPKDPNEKEVMANKELRDAKELRDLKEMKDFRESIDRNSNEIRKESQSTTDNKVTNDQKQEKFERFEKIERVENGDAVQQVLEKFRMYGIVFSAIVLALLMTLVAIAFRKQNENAKAGEVHSAQSAQGPGRSAAPEESGSLSNEEKASLISKRVESDRLFTDLTNIFSEQPKVAKHVFTHVLTEEGVETTAQYLELFGESVVMDLLRDPGLQSDLTELMDFFARNTFDINDDERLMLLKKLYHRTVTAKMQVHGSRSAALFDFLAEMDAPQIFEMIKNESNTVRAIVLTQCDQKKRQVIFNAHDDNTRMKLMTELSRIDHLPKNYIYNVASALRRKKTENPKLNTEALPGSDVLVSFLEKSSIATQRTIIHQLMSDAGMDALQNLKAKLVSIETLRFIKDQQLTEVVTHVKHDELVQFMKGCSQDVRDSVLNKISPDLAAEISDELSLAEPVTREAYLAVERKVLNRMKVLANNGQINIAEINERIFSDEFGAAQSQSEVADVGMKKAG